jgi:hypothetical protein
LRGKINSNDPEMLSISGDFVKPGRGLMQGAGCATDGVVLMTEALNHVRLAMCIFKGGEYVSLLKAFCERIVVPGFPLKYLSCDLFNWIVEDGLGRTFKDLRSKENVDQSRSLICWIRFSRQ